MPSSVISGENTKDHTISDIPQVAEVRYESQNVSQNFMPVDAENKFIPLMQRPRISVDVK